MPRLFIVTVTVTVITTVCLAVGCTGKPGGTAGFPGSPATSESLKLGKEVVAFVAIPSLDSVFADIVAVGEAVDPGSITTEKLAAQVGGLLGDPQLQTFRRDKPLLLVALGGSGDGAVTIAGFLPAKEGSSAPQFLAAMNLPTKQSGDVLMVAQSPEALTAAEKARSVYDKIAAAKLDATFSLFADVGRLIETYRPMLDQQIAALSGMATTFGGQSVATILKAEAKAFLSLLSQGDGVSLTMDMGGQGISGDFVLEAKPATALGKFFQASAGRKIDVPDYVGTRGVVTASGSIDVESLSAVVDGVLQDIGKAPELAALLTPEVTSMWTEMGSWWTGAMRLSYGFSANGLEYDGVMSIADEAKMLEVMEKSAAMFTPGGAFHGVYKSMGMDLSGTFKKNAREHAGVPVHVWEMAVKGGDNIPGIGKLMNMNMHMAVVSGHGLISTDEARIERYVDDAKAGKAGKPSEPEASKVFGANGQGYIDFDFAALMKGVGLLTGQDVFEPLPPTPPVTTAVFFAGDAMRVQSRVPIELIKAMVTLQPPKAKLPR